MAAPSSIINTTNSISVKALTRCSSLKSIPSQFQFTNDTKASSSDSIPIVDYSLLTAGSPDQRSKVLQDLAQACEEWGFFVLVNHVIPESLMKKIIDTSLEYFELPDEEKRQYEPKTASDPIKSGSGSALNTANDRVHLWRDYVKSYVHPQFHCPHKPQIFRDTVFEYSEKTRIMARKLLQAMSENLGLEEGYMNKALNLDSCFQLYAANYYPPCPQPDQAIGIPPHTDPGLLTFLIHNGVDGLQIMHNGEWFNADSPQNSVLVNIADHLEIFSNGRYKSVKHRAVVNAEARRISAVVANGAAPDAIVSPAAKLVERDGRSLYRSMKFMEYVERQLSNRISGKSNLDCIKID